MPSQQLEVRVRVSGMGRYASEMQKGATATKQLATAGENVRKVGGRISNVGDTLTRNVTLPIVAVGAAATKMSMDFDNAFTQMQTLAGLSAGEVDGLKESVLGLAGETGKAPQELAEALYFLRSSGLEGKAALDALEVSAKASAAGLGDTQTIADAVSSAMLGYAQSGLEAAEATDVLIATARAGKAEPAELAAQMGRLIPTAAELGITFADVGGAIAALSTKGNNAEASTTQLVNVMGKLLKPSQQAMEALDGVGLSTDRIRDLIAEKGLLGTLEVLKERLGDSGFVKFFEDQQAVQGALALTGGDLEKTRDIFEQVNDSVGATDDAFETWAESMGSKNARAFAQLQVAMIRFGDAIAPLASDLISFAASVLGVFSDLPEPVQKAAIALLAVVAAAGPLMSVGGRLISVWGSAMKIFENWTSAGGRAFADAVNAGTEATNNLGSKMGGLQRAAGLAAGAAGIGAVLFAIDEMGKAAARARTADLVEEFVATKDAAETLQPAIEGSAFEMGQMSRTFDALLDQNPVLAQQYLDQAEALGLNKDMVESAQAAIDQKKEADVNAADAAEQYQAESEGVTEGMADQEQAVNEAAEAFKTYADQLRGTFDPVFGMLNALKGADEAQRDVAESLANLTEARRVHGAGSAEATAAEIAYRDALDNVGTSALDVETAAAALNAAVAENPELIDDAMAALQDWRDKGIIPTDAQLQFLQNRILGTTGHLTDLGEQRPTPTVSLRGDRDARIRLRAVKDATTGIPTKRNIAINVFGAHAAVAMAQSVRENLLNIPRFRDITIRQTHRIVGATDTGPTFHEGGVVPGRRGQEVAAVLLGQEEVLAYDDPRHSANLGRLSGHMVPATGFVGGGAQVVNLDLRGAIITGGERQFRRMVTRAVNEVQRKGRGLNAA